MKKSRVSLTVIYSEIAARVESIRESRPWWPCKEGCDSCCRSLTTLPELTQAEWELLQMGLNELSSEELTEVRRCLSQEMEKDSGFEERYVCPLLDQGTGACKVYNYRPSECRSYGFFASRNRDLWCDKIGQSLEEHGANDVIWGNRNGVDRKLNELSGEIRPLSEYFFECF